jgi:hypothetical protein
MNRLTTTRFFAGLAIVLALANIFMVGSIVFASTNISSTASEHWAWNDLIGWINFNSSGNVTVSSQQLTGWADSNVGIISLDCGTSGIPNLCTTSNYKITNDGLGTLGGYAWNDTYGWISFSCANHGCATSTYGVSISASTGDFGGAGAASGYAWNDIIGWISFNCKDVGGQSFCDNVSNYKVKTSWTATSTTGTLDSTTYDTGLTTGAELDSLIWQGSLPSGTAVQFQVATSPNTTGPWTYLGPDGTTATWYTGNPNTSISLNTSAHNGNRYFRYRVMLVSNQAQTLTPQVNDVIINWSP